MEPVWTARHIVGTQLIDQGMLTVVTNKADGNVNGCWLSDWLIGEGVHNFFTYSFIHHMCHSSIPQKLSEETGIKIFAHCQPALCIKLTYPPQTHKILRITSHDVECDSPLLQRRKLKCKDIAWGHVARERHSELWPMLLARLSPGSPHPGSPSVAYPSQTQPCPFFLTLSICLAELERICSQTFFLNLKIF